MFIEKASGKNTDRPELKKMLTYARNGDVLYIESISRLARSVKDLLNIVELLKAKNVGLISYCKKQREPATENSSRFSKRLSVFSGVK
jgi:DNA invertase Pin-like site-specific DNA recombinase